MRAPRCPPPPGILRRLAETHLVLEGAAPDDAQLPAELVRRAGYVHAFRLGLVPLARAWRDHTHVRVGVDLDDLESDTLSAIGQLASAERDHGLAWAFDALARAAQRFEREWLPRLSRVAVCSERDRRMLRARMPDAHLTVLPNVFEPPSTPPLRQLDARMARLIFVGALGYYPNVDAVRFCATEVLPRVRVRSSRPVELHIVGRGSTRALRRALRGVPNLVLHRAVDDLAPLYAQSHVALCPIRAGGGTRIKILEAFARGVPVVSSTTGAAGLDITHGQELLLADDAESFAEAVLQVLGPLGGQIAERARHFVRVHHAEDRFGAALRELAGA